MASNTTGVLASQSSGQSPCQPVKQLVGPLSTPVKARQELLTDSSQPALSATDLAKKDDRSHFGGVSGLSKFGFRSRSGSEWANLDLTLTLTPSCIEQAVSSKNMCYLLSSLEKDAVDSSKPFGCPVKPFFKQPQPKFGKRQSPWIEIFYLVNPPHL